MIKLISQFDNEKMRASVATPTCGPCCSCSCCCCIVSTIATSIVTSRNFGKIVEKNYENGNKPYEEARNAKMEAYVLGALLIPLVITSIILYFMNNVVSLILGILYLLWLVNFITKHEGSKKKIILLTILSIITFLGLAYGEIFVWLKFVFS